MNEKYNVYLVSDSTGETLDRIFLSLKSQFANFEYKKKEFEKEKQRKRQEFFTNRNKKRKKSR